LISSQEDILKEIANTKLLNSSVGLKKNLHLLFVDVDGQTCLGKKSGNDFSCQKSGDTTQSLFDINLNLCESRVSYT